LVVGVSGTKKADYLLNIARCNATHGKRVIFINLKNSVDDLTVRLLLINSRVPVREILLKQMTEENWDKVVQIEYGTE
jgi:hypothetical protein